LFSAALYKQVANLSAAVTPVLVYTSHPVAVCHFPSAPAAFT